MTDSVFKGSYFSISEPLDEAGSKLATATLLVRLEGELRSIDGLTDDDILHIVVSRSTGWEGRPEVEATVYYSLESG
jgi:hypothetical protein